MSRSGYAVLTVAGSISTKYTGCKDLNDMTRIKHQTYHGIVYADGSFKAPNGLNYSREQMLGFIRDFKGMNRIHKPMSLLYYTDVMNGRGTQWTKTIER